MDSSTPPLQRRAAIKLLLAGLSGSTGVAAFAQQTDYPNRPIRMLLPYGPGGIGDATARIIAQKMSDDLGQSLIIENRPGAGGVTAFVSAKQAAADGYTLVMGGNGTAISQSLFKKLPYSVLDDFTQVSAMSKFSLVLLVNPDSRFHSVGELIAAAKAKPGKLSFGTSSIGSTQNLAAELFKSMAGIDAQVVPYREAASLYTGLRARDIDLAFEFLPPVLAQIQGGLVRGLAIAADQRNAGLPTLPTAAESGLKGYEVTSWNAVSVRTGTPTPIVDRLNKAFVAAITAPEVSAKLRALNSEPYPLSPVQTRQLMVAEIARWKAVIEKADIPKT